MIEVGDFLAAIGSPAAVEGAVQVGDTVYGSDRGKIGTVEEVVRARDGASGYLVVPRGVVFDKDTLIPFDAVTHRAEDRVYINVPKLVIGKLPWNEPPTGDAVRSKIGARTEDVTAFYRSHGPSGVEPEAM